MDLSDFAAAVGLDDPVVVAGGMTQWEVGGPVDDAARIVEAPCGVRVHEPAEMTVRVAAGTPVVDLDLVLAERRQTVALPAWPGATVGGVLAVGHSGVRRLGWGPVRDTVLEIRFVTAEGRLATAGGPTVKNVSGFDLCRLLVGSLGTLGLLGEVILRTRPVPERERWLRGAADPTVVRGALFAPTTMLWDGAEVWVLLSGTHGDVDAQSSVATSLGLVEVEGPPPLPPHRWSCRPRDVPSLPGSGWIAEVGVGVVHHPEPAPPRQVDEAVRGIHAALKAEFDPTGRLAPGRSVLA